MANNTPGPVFHKLQSDKPCLFGCLFVFLFVCLFVCLCVACVEGELGAELFFISSVRLCCWPWQGGCWKTHPAPFSFVMLCLLRFTHGGVFGCCWFVCLWGDKMIWGNVVCVCLFVCLFVCVFVCLLVWFNWKTRHWVFKISLRLCLWSVCGCLFVCLFVWLVASLCGLVLFCC